jgi:hypothetical protein
MQRVPIVKSAAPCATRAKGCYDRRWWIPWGPTAAQEPFAISAVIVLTGIESEHQVDSAEFRTPPESVR